MSRLVRGVEDVDVLFQRHRRDVVRRECRTSHTTRRFPHAGPTSPGPSPRPTSPPELFDAIAETALTQGERFNSQDLANLAQAFSNARRSSPKLFDFIAKTCLQRGLGAFNSQDLANTAFAFGTAGHASRELFDAIGEAAPRSIGSFTGQGLANTLWAYCVLGVDAPAFFTAAAEAPACSY